MSFAKLKACKGRGRFVRIHFILQFGLWVAALGVLSRGSGLTHLTDACFWVLADAGWNRGWAGDELVNKCALRLGSLEGAFIIINVQQRLVLRLAFPTHRVCGCPISAWSLGPLENTRAREGERVKCLRNKDTQRQTDLGELTLLSGLVRILSFTH